MVKYSFIVPVFNCEAYLKDCVESILGQSGDHSAEVILVDDGAQDRSGQIADELAEKHPQVRAFHKENGGAASARNYGIGQAVGKYILFIDGDDTVDPGLLDAVDACLSDAAQPFMVYGMSFDYYGKGMLKKTEKMSCQYSGCFSVHEVLNDFYGFFTDNAMSSACNKVFSAEVIRQNNLCFPEGMTLYEDLEFVLRYLMYTKSVCCIDTPYYHYRHDLEKPHLRSRVQDLKAVEKNLSRLLDTALQLNDVYQIPAERSLLLTAMADLYLELLSGSLLFRSYSLEEMRGCMPRYCNGASFRRVLERGARLSPAEQEFLNKIDAGRFRDIRREYQKRKLISKGKRLAKKLLRKQ